MPCRCQPNMMTRPLNARLMFMSRALVLTLASSTASAETLKLSGAGSPLVNGNYRPSETVSQYGARWFVKIGSDGVELEGDSSMGIQYGPWGIGPQNNGWGWVIVRTTTSHYVPYTLYLPGGTPLSGDKSHLPPLTGWAVHAGQAPLPLMEYLCDAGEYLEASQPPMCTVCSNGTYQASEKHRNQTCIEISDTKCSGAGVFDVTIGCVCGAGFAGSLCELHGDVYCNGLGAVTPAGTCDCINGAHGDHCQCIEHPEHPGDSEVCLECAQGYESSLRNSTECSRCTSRGERDPGSGECLCKVGWSGGRCECFNGASQSATQVCKLCDPRYLLEGGTCVLTPASATSTSATAASTTQATTMDLTTVPTTANTIVAATSTTVTTTTTTITGTTTRDRSTFTSNMSSPTPTEPEVVNRELKGNSNNGAGKVVVIILAVLVIACILLVVGVGAWLIKKRKNGGETTGRANTTNDSTYSSPNISSSA